MKRDLFFDKIRNSYFDELSCSFSDFVEMIKGVMPVFGKLEITKIEGNEGDTITFRDIDQAMMVLAPEGYEVTDSDMDMSTTLMKITLDKNNVIKTVSHGISLFTPANKDLVLFLGSIIGKGITY